MTDRNHHHRRGTDPVISLIIVNGIGGALVAAMMVTGILLLDIGHLGTLVATSDAPVVAVGLLSMGFIVTFSSLAMGSAIMRIGGGDHRNPEGRRLIPVRARAPRRR